MEKNVEREDLVSLQINIKSRLWRRTALITIQQLNGGG